VTPAGHRGQRHPDQHGLALARPDQAAVVDQLGHPGRLERAGHARVALVDGDRGTAGQPAELLDGLRLDLVSVDRRPIAVRHQNNEAVVRNAGEHALDDAP
jgi:hypothetical protein